MSVAQVPSNKTCLMSPPSGHESPLLHSGSLDIECLLAPHVPASVRVHVSLPCGDANKMQPCIEIEAAGAEEFLCPVKPSMSDLSSSASSSSSSSQSTLWPNSSHNTDSDVEGSTLSSKNLEQVARSKSVKSVGFVFSPTHSVHESEHSVQPYSEIYGQHPREFVFGLHGQRLPTPPPGMLTTPAPTGSPKHFQKNRMGFKAIFGMFQRSRK